MSCIVKAEAKILSRANKQLSAVEICWPCPSAKRGSPKCFPAWSSCCCCCLFPSEGVLCWCFAAADEEKAAPKRKTKDCSLIASVMRKKKKTASRRKTQDTCVLWDEWSRMRTTLKRLEQSVLRGAGGIWRASSSCFAGHGASVFFLEKREDLGAGIFSAKISIRNTFLAYVCHSKST